jgi:uracil-DNA glycosylase family 4
LASSEIAAAIEEVHSQVRRCRKCALSRSRTHVVPGEGSLTAELMFVGEGPGAEEDQQGRPFVGTAGRLLTQLLRSIGIERENVFITNVVKCRPPGNRDPLPEEIAACNDYLLAQIALLTPKVICTLGRFAGQTLLDKAMSITREHGRPRRMSGILYVPLYHPAAALHKQDLIGALEDDFRKLGAILEQEGADLPSRAPAAGAGRKASR